MGVPGRLGRRSIALAAVLALAFGMSAGFLVARWSEAEASQRRVSAAAPAGVITAVEKARPARPAKATRARSVRVDPLNRTCGAPGGRLIAYRVAVQRGLDTDRAAFARAVHAILCDQRSWIGSERVRFRYDPRARVTVNLLTADATERRCMSLIGLSVGGTWSCAARSRGQVVLNADRWFGGSPSWPGSVARYRAMLVNHEVGHILGHGHRSCSSGGAKAPVMMQQSKGTLGCRPNPWPTRSELAVTR
jgi:hypothetical protein